MKRHWVLLHYGVLGARTPRALRLSLAQENRLNTSPPDLIVLVLYLYEKREYPQFTTTPERFQAKDFGDSYSG